MSAYHPNSVNILGTGSLQTSEAHKAKMALVALSKKNKA